MPWELSEQALKGQSKNGLIYMQKKNNKQNKLSTHGWLCLCLQLEWPLDEKKIPLCRSQQQTQS